MIGLVISIILVQRQQIFKSKANLGIFNSITISEVGQDGQEREGICQENNCQTSSKQIKMRINLKQLEDLQNN